MPPAQTTPSQATTTEMLDHERLNSLINSMGDGVIATDEMVNVVLYNGAALNILDINGDLKGKPLASGMKLIDKNNQPVDITDYVKKTNVSEATREYRLAYSDSSVVNLYISVARVHLGYGKGGEKGFVILLRDITREKSLEEERDEFVSVVSHELRTPITIAEGNISNTIMMLERAGLNNPQVKSALEQAHSQVEFLAGLINDLATLSRAERGELAVDAEDINAHDLLSELVTNYMPMAAKKNLELRLATDPSLELLKSNKLYVREILQNFITNSLKYTEKGSITVGAAKADKGVLFSVSDTGIGISKSDQEKVFDKFFRSEDFRTRKNNGTGLGLYVTLKLARLIHAEVKMQSELNVGSVFTIYVPNLK